VAAVVARREAGRRSKVQAQAAMNAGPVDIYKQHMWRNLPLLDACAHLTGEQLDTRRSRQFPCEVWYPATGQHAGQDLVSATQDVFGDAPSDTLRS
jgi:hypothetical protein